MNVTRWIEYESEIGDGDELSVKVNNGNDIRVEDEY